MYMTQLSVFQTLPPTTDDAILDHLSITEIIRFGRTCSNAHVAVQSYIKRRFKLSDVLARFFKEQTQVEELRTLMSNTGMVISGSAALQLFQRNLYADSDLDLYTPLHNAQQIADWLISKGYTFVPSVQSLPTVETAISEAVSRHTTPPLIGATPSTRRGYLRAACILDFRATNPVRKIQLIASVRSVLELILGFHSTCVMNFITHEKAYCLFPRATLVERRALTYLNRTIGHESNRNAYVKWTARGFQLGDCLTQAEFDDPGSAFAPGMRFVGDSKRLVFPIHFLREDFTGQKEGTVEVNSFALEYNGTLEPVFNSCHVNLEGLRYPYVLTEDEAVFILQEVTPYGVVHLRQSNRTIADVGKVTFDLELKGLMTTLRNMDAESDPASDPPDSGSEPDEDDAEGDENNETHGELNGSCEP
ncbi:hypothetical protein D9619_007568 [Psilocybe cf. subviscida]|uniref:F-box domain-containing protein n=1 Tax=Psilocybe cf. subviscida TaxID=2480587 RepID=A0A8H5B1X7_9AGAR|nr:hypothetical protein D9619_007568 [Psilocybe cf. subviscida]